MLGLNARGREEERDREEENTQMNNRSEQEAKNTKRQLEDQHEVSH